ncbi:MAG: hypothetical protein WC391_00225 [Methanoregula sp.]|jgi:hypothetical protein
MERENTLSPCAADALQGTRLIEIEGKDVGIAALDETITEVMDLGLREDAAISNELMVRIAHNNFIPEALQNAYAKAVLAEYVAVRMKVRMERALKNYESIRND